MSLPLFHCIPHILHKWTEFGTAQVIATHHK